MDLQGMELQWICYLRVSRERYVKDYGKDNSGIVSRKIKNINQGCFARTQTIGSSAGCCKELLMTVAYQHRLIADITTLLSLS